MKKFPKITPAPNWQNIFKLNPHLEAPGYKETTELIQKQKHEQSSNG